MYSDSVDHSSRLARPMMPEVRTLTMDRIFEAIAETQRLCDAVQTVEVKRPDSIRERLLDLYNMVRGNMRQLHAEVDRMVDRPTNEIRSLAAAYQRLRGSVNEAVTILERARDDDDRDGLDVFSRTSSPELPAQDVVFGLPTPDYDGWRRRP